jgi:CHAT domain-containing protein
LGIALKTSHSDSWLSDLLDAHPSTEAIDMLHQAISANKRGDLDGAIRFADAAVALFNKTGNKPGTFRAQFERLYAQRRKSHAQTCSDESGELERELHNTSYSWLKIQTALERASCLAMADNLDGAWVTASGVGLLAEQVNYRSLQLRAIAMEASLHSNEGRLEKAWSTSETGLSLFFDDAFPPERGFQFYSELEFAAEEAEQWHLAELLQKEAIAYIRSLGRLDFEATANFHLAAVEEVLGNIELARSDIANGQKLFQLLPSGSSREFLEAESRIALAALEAKFGSVTSAADYVAGLDSVVSQADNFTVQLDYEQTLADIQQRLGHTEEEARHLRQSIEIGNKGFSSLKSPRDRWDWEHTVGKAYRQLIELQISGSHRPVDALAAWKRYRAASSPYPELLMSGTAGPEQPLMTQTNRLKNASAIVFAVLSDQVVGWVADDRGIREIKLGVTSSEVTPLVKEFYRLCSTPTSSTEKVKASGLRLYQLLIRPLDKELPLRQTVFIEADGVLGEVPWGALTTSDGAYLAAKFEIVIAPGLNNPPPFSHGPKTTFLIAYPGPVSVDGELYPSLVHAQEEADLLAKSNTNSLYLVGESVTSTNLADNLQHAQQFHFAGHAVSREFGGELIVHGRTGGELFSASAISSLDLRRLQLAVLAACSTATSVEAARNPHGLVGAFLQAGTRRVIASSWAVDSETTKQLMVQFYSFLGTDVQKPFIDKAWKSALLTVLDVQHPYYWAGYQVYGTPN